MCQKQTLPWHLFSLIWEVREFCVFCVDFILYWGNLLHNSIIPKPPLSNQEQSQRESETSWNTVVRSSDIWSPSEATNLLSSLWEIGLLAAINSNCWGTQCEYYWIKLDKTKCLKRLPPSIVSQQQGIDICTNLIQSIVADPWIYVYVYSTALIKDWVMTTNDFNFAFHLQ